MRLRSVWTPRLEPGREPLSERLAAALSSDIIGERLDGGARLPAQRDLAFQLGIGTGTVTKAYAALERRGLVRSVKGSGTFVAVIHKRRGPLINLADNAPPSVITDKLLSRTFSAIARRIDTGLYNSYPPVGGHDEHRRLMSGWLAGLGIDASPSHLLLTAGAQHALSVAFSIACNGEGSIHTEAQTYARAITLARYQGRRMAGVAIDGEGLLPDSLDRALHDAPGDARTVYVTPTLQNPTTATMGRERRKAIVAVCRARNATIIEDDVYTLDQANDLPALMSLAPERTLYVNSLSKTVDPALRIGVLVLPPTFMAAAEDVLHATAIMASSTSCAVMQQWLLDGTAAEVRQAVQTEARRRNGLARSILGNAIVPASLHGHHVWLPMTRQATLLVEAAARGMGVAVTPPLSTAIDPETLTSGIRLCIGAPPPDELASGLVTLSTILSHVR